MRGQEFYQLHKLFDDLAEPLEEHIDIIAERAVTLGGLALGTVRSAAAASELPEFPLQPGGLEYAKELGAALRQGRQLRSRSDRYGGRPRRRGHRRSLHRALPRARQEPLFPRGALPGIGSFQRRLAGAMKLRECRDSVRTRTLASG